MADKPTPPGDGEEQVVAPTGQTGGEAADPHEPATEPGADRPTAGAESPPPDDDQGDAEMAAPDDALPDGAGGDDRAGPADGDDEVPAAPARRRTLTPAGAVVALLLVLLGFTLVVQLKAVATDPTLAAARQEDLVRILSDLDSRQERLRQDIADLEESKRQLTTAGQSQEAALAEAARRADELGILAGTLPVEGPGVTVTMRAGADPVSAATVLDAVQELRGAGAEAMQLTGGDGTAVRVVASTYFVDSGDAILVDGETLSGPYTLTVIGEPGTLAPALNIPGGVVESVQSNGGTVIVQEEPDVVQVSVVRSPVTLQHARPVS